MANFWTKPIGDLFSKKSNTPIAEEQQTAQVFQGPALVNGGMLMITNGAPHPAEKWAEATARLIVDVADNIAGERRGAAIKLQGAVIEALEKHHNLVQKGERGKISSDGHSRLGTQINAEDHLSVADAVAEIQECAKGTQWESDFAKPEAVAHIDKLLRQHFHTSMAIERSWHADRNPTTPEAIAFRSSFNIGGA